MPDQRIRPRRRTINDSEPTESELISGVKENEMVVDHNTGQVWFRIDDTDNYSNDFTKIDAQTLGGETKDDIIKTASGGDPKVRALGNYVNYTGSNSFTSELIHYSRVFLRADHTYRWVRHFTQSNIQNITFDVGIYSDNNRQPDTLVENSGVVSRDVNDGEFFDIELSNTFSPSKSNYYWIAFLNTEGHNTKCTPNGVNANVGGLPSFHPTLTEARLPSNGLPSNATPSVSSIQWPWYAVVAE